MFIEGQSALKCRESGLKHTHTLSCVNYQMINEKGVDVATKEKKWIKNYGKFQNITYKNHKS